MKFKTQHRFVRNADVRLSYEAHRDGATTWVTRNHNQVGADVQHESVGAAKRWMRDAQ